ncbi:hypothetical protein GLOIN_2v1845029 [Rhizophagus clarus]|uniref:Uncharacterized protein n=1 Tax=Rhizophagus clarus TaxID=94130 RepID=A0A8H3M3U2_9GLOM|nr:hypothetical protein GLOIN_2v1845029 [Rhizophagus clarus]
MRDDFPVFSNIMFALHIVNSFFFKYSLFDKPSNKNRDWSSIVLFAFDDIEDIKKELKNEPRNDQNWNKSNNYDEGEDKSNCNKANILYYYKYGEALKKKIQNNTTLSHEFILERYIPEKIDYIESLSASDIARLEEKEIAKIIQNIKSPTASP